MTIAITPFPRVTDVSLRSPSLLDWDDLVARFSAFKVADAKNHVTGYSPAVFAPVCTCGKEGCQRERGHRVDPTVVSLYALAFDVDKAADKSPLSQAAADAALARIGDIGLRTSCTPRSPAQFASSRSPKPPHRDRRNRRIVITETAAS